jgi:hypothetical protein
MGNMFDNVSRVAADQTNQDLSQELSSLTGISVDKLKALFPAPIDQSYVKQLIDIVTNATTENDKINQLREKAETCGKVALKLIGSFIKPV